MRYLRQLFIILAFCFVGEALAAVLPLPIPAFVYGLLLMLGALAMRVVPLEAVADTGNFLVALLPVFFIAPVLRLLDIWDAIAPFLLPVCMLIAVSTLVTFALSGAITQALLKRVNNGERHG